MRVDTRCLPEALMLHRGFPNSPNHHGGVKTGVGPEFGLHEYIVLVVAALAVDMFVAEVSTNLF